MRTSLVAAALLAALLAPGCGRRTVVTTYPYTFPGEADLRARQSWVGHTERELRDKLGAPTRTRTDGKGGREMVYERDRAVEVRTGSDHPASPVPGARVPGSAAASPSRRDVVKKEVARFFVGPDGVIYRADVSAEAWRKGLVPPPPPSKDDAS